VCTRFVDRVDRAVNVEDGETTITSLEIRSFAGLDIVQPAYLDQI